MRALPALVLALLCACSAAPQAGLDFDFHRHDGRLEIRGDLAAARRAGIETATSRNGADALGVRDAALAPGMHVQLMQFGFRSRGFFAAEPQAHLAFGLGGSWRKADAARGVDGFLIGRGVIVGNVRDARMGCDAAPVVQIEVFWRTGNLLAAASCSVPLAEDTWYRLTLAATRDGGIAYRLDAADGRTLAASAFHDRSAAPNPGAAGWWLLHVFADRHPEREWRFEVRDLRVWQRPRSARATPRADVR